MITKEQALELLSSIADNPPRVCVAWCGKAKDDCACFKAHVAREAVNGQAEDALQTVIALHERVDRLTEALARSQRAIKPFADRVFNDNGDYTVSDTHTLTAADYWNAQSAEQAARATITQAQIARAIRAAPILRQSCDTTLPRRPYSPRTARTAQRPVKSLPRR